MKLSAEQLGNAYRGLTPLQKESLNEIQNLDDRVLELCKLSIYSGKPEQYYVQLRGEIELQLATVEKEFIFIELSVDELREAYQALTEENRSIVDAWGEQYPERILELYKLTTYPNKDEIFYMVLTAQIYQQIPTEEFAGIFVLPPTEPPVE